MSLQKLGRYELIRVLGKGAMGLVYEGLDPNLNRRVAIKTIRVENLSEEAAAEYEVRFKVEAQSAARLQHPNIVSVYDSARDGDIAYMVMEFIQGDDLKHHLDQGTLYSLGQTLGIMQDLLSALGYAHAQNVVHRDIKPANLLIEQNGRIKLTDFGVARIQDSGEATRTQGTMVGTLKYMSPEQVQGRPVDARADIFAAGIVLYQLLTGKRPFDGATDFAVIQQIVGHTPAAPTFFNSKLPRAIDAVVGRALAKVREQRFASAKEFLQALQAAARDTADATFVPPASPRTPGGQSVMTPAYPAGDALLGSQSGLHSNPNIGQSTVTQEIELVYWKDIKDSDDITDIQCFMAKFPSGIYADLARRRLRQLGVTYGDESELGRQAGTATVVLPRGAHAYEPTMVLEGGRGLPAGAAAASRGAGPGDDAPETLFQSTEQVDWAPEPAPGQRPGVASRLTAMELMGDVTLPPVPLPAPPRAGPPRAAPPRAAPMYSAPMYSAPPGKPFVPESSVVPPMKLAAPRESTAVPRRTLLWAVAGMLLLAGAGLGLSRMNSSASSASSVNSATSSSSATAANVVIPATSAGAGVATGAGIVAAIPAPAAALPLTSSTASASSLSPSPPGAAALPPVSAVAATPGAAAAQVFTLGAEPPTLTTAAESRTAADARAAKKADRDQEKLARQPQTQAQATGADPAAPAEPVPDPPPVKRSAPTPVAAAPSGASSPRQVCENRVFLGYEICVAEQCAKRAFTNHPICVDRRAMEDRRRDAEQLRR